MVIKRRCQAAGILVALVSGLAVLLAQSIISSPAMAADPIKVGWVGPLSPPGGYADGTLMKQGAEMAVEEINAKGGVLGRPIELIIADTRGMAEEGTAAAERLISKEKVIAICGEFHSSPFLAEMEVAHKAGIPIIGVDVWNLKITASGYPEVFRVSPNQALIQTKYADWIAAVGFKHVAVVYEMNEGGQSAIDVLKPALDKHGVKYDIIGADQNATDFTALLERLKASNPPYDFVIAEYSLAGAYPMLSQSAELGLAPSKSVGFANSGGPATTETFWQNVKGAGKYVITEIVGLPKAADNNVTKHFKTGFKKKYNQIPSPQAISNYDTMFVIADAIKRAKSTDGKKLIAALEKTDLVLGRGRYRFSKSHTPDWAWHQFMEAPVALIQYDKEGQAVDDAPILWPRNIATTKSLFLKP
jgi:branched-chain amino acid transport system substrate-binding protein